MLRPAGSFALLTLLMFSSAARPADPAADALGDPLPPGALVRIGTLRLRHADQVFAVALAPDGKTLASGGDDRLIRLWETATGKELRTFAGHTDGVNAVAFFSDGKTLVSAGEDGIARLWNVESGKERLVFRGHGTSPVKCVAVAPDDKTIATKGDDGAVRVWDAAVGKELLNIPSEKGHGRSAVTFAPDGKTLAGIGADGGIAIWEAKTGKELLRFTDPDPGDVTSLAFTPDGKRLASGGLDRMVRLWDVERGKLLRELGTMPDLVAAVCFSPDGKMLAASGADGSIRLCDSKGKELRILKGHTDTVEALTMSRDGKVLASASHDCRVRLWDPATGQELPQSAHPQRLTAALSADGKLLATGHEDGTIRFWDAATGKPRPGTLEGKGAVIEVCLAPDGTMVAARRAGVDRVGVWDVASGRLLCEIDERPAAGIPNTRPLAGPLAFSPDGKILAHIDRQRVVNLWEAKSGKPLPRSPLKVEGDPAAESLAFAPDGTLAVGYNDSHVLCWNVASGRVVQQIILPGGRPTGLAFSSDGRCVATAAGDGGVKVWERSSGQERTVDGADERAVTAVAFSTDGRLLIAAGPDGMVRIAERYSRTPVKTLSGHRGGVTKLAIGGSRLLSVGTDGTALVWDRAGIEPPRREVKELTPPQLAALWDDLANDKAAEGYQAMMRAIEAGPQAVAPLRERLEKVAAMDDKRLARLIADLDADEFETRENATKELETIGTLVVPALRKVLKGVPSAEVRQRAEGLLGKLDGPGSLGQQQRPARAVEVLEAIGTPEAIKALEAVSKRPSNDDLAHEVKAALERLKKRPTP